MGAEAVNQEIPTQREEVRVLHVDDERALLDLTVEMLTRENDEFDVVSETSAADALDRLTEERIDCIVSDYDMPGMDGLEFLKAVREQYPNLPFILFTGKGSEEVASNAFSAGATDYVQKSSGTDQYTILTNRITNSVDRARSEARQERQLAAIEHAQEGISILDEEGYFVYVNETYADLYGYDPAEMVGEHWELIYPEDEVAYARQEIIPTAEKEGHWHGQTTGLRSDGSTFSEDHVVSATETGELVCTVRDLSARQEGQRELNQYRALVETLDDPVYVLDENGRFEYVNDAFVEMVGYERETVLGSTPSLIKSAEAVEEGEAQLGRVLSSDGPDSVNFEVDIQPKDGDPIPCEDHMGVLPYEGESFDGSVGILRDITDRKSREEELLRYRRLVEAVGDPVYALDADGYVTYVNDAYVDKYGYDRDEIVGEHVSTVIPDDDVQRGREIIQDLLADETRQIAAWELTNVTADGERFEAENHLALLTGENGEFRGTVGVIRDVTERKNHLVELQRYETLIDVLGDPVYALDTDGCFTYVNDKLVEVAGYDREDLLGEHVSLILPEDELERGKALLQELLTTAKRTAAVEMEVLLRDGSRLTVENNVALLQDDDGEIRGTAGVVRDISERKAREEQLERQNKRLDEFASIVSHDLQNPLRVAQGRLKLASEECDSEHLEDIATAHERMETIIDDLLTYAREGTTVENLTSIDLASVAEQAMDATATSDATLSIESDQAIEADLSALQRLLENLIRNAIEHGGQDVSITIADLENGFYVVDDGPGVPPDEREDIFEAGYSSKDGGTGLGLAIVRTIVEAHGWEITLTENADGGARFDIVTEQ